MIVYEWFRYIWSSCNIFGLEMGKEVWVEIGDSLIFIVILSVG